MRAPRDLWGVSCRTPQQGARIAIGAHSICRRLGEDHRIAVLIVLHSFHLPNPLPCDRPDGAPIAARSISNRRYRLLGQNTAAAIIPEGRTGGDGEDGMGFEAAGQPLPTACRPSGRPSRSPRVTPGGAAPAIQICRHCSAKIICAMGRARAPLPAGPAVRESCFGHARPNERDVAPSGGAYPSIRRSGEPTGHAPSIVAAGIEAHGGIAQPSTRLQGAPLRSLQLRRTPAVRWSHYRVLILFLQAACGIRPVPLHRNGSTNGRTNSSCAGCRRRLSLILGKNHPPPCMGGLRIDELTLLSTVDRGTFAGGNRPASARLPAALNTKRRGCAEWLRLSRAPTVVVRATLAAHLGGMRSPNGYPGNAAEHFGRHRDDGGGRRGDASFGTNR